MVVPLPVWRIQREETMMPWEAWLLLALHLGGVLANAYSDGDPAKRITGVAIGLVAAFLVLRLGGAW